MVCLNDMNFFLLEKQCDLMEEKLENTDQQKE